MKTGMVSGNENGICLRDAVLLIRNLTTDLMACLSSYELLRKHAKHCYNAQGGSIGMV